MENVERLKKGNERFVKSGTPQGDFSAKRRTNVANGQNPFAAILACADSRVIPEAIFDVGIGELFVVRCAGNVVGDTELASLEYATHHLGVKTVVVLGHTGCGAIAAAIHGEFGGNIGVITKRIKSIIGEEVDPYAATRYNSIGGAAYLREKLSDVEIVSAVYDIKSGKVDFI